MAFPAEEPPCSLKVLLAMGAASTASFASRNGSTSPSASQITLGNMMNAACLHVLRAEDPSMLVAMDGAEGSESDEEKDILRPSCITEALLLIPDALAGDARTVAWSLPRLCADADKLRERLVQRSRKKRQQEKEGVAESKVGQQGAGAGGADDDEEEGVKAASLSASRFSSLYLACLSRVRIVLLPSSSSSSSSSSSTSGSGPGSGSGSGSGSGLREAIKILSRIHAAAPSTQAISSGVGGGLLNSYHCMAAERALVQQHQQHQHQQGAAWIKMTLLGGGGGTDQQTSFLPTFIGIHGLDLLMADYHQSLSESGSAITTTTVTTNAATAMNTGAAPTTTTSPIAASERSQTLDSPFVLSATARLLSLAKDTLSSFVYRQLWKQRIIDERVVTTTARLEEFAKSARAAAAAAAAAAGAGGGAGAGGEGALAIAPPSAAGAVAVAVVAPPPGASLPPDFAERALACVHPSLCVSFLSSKNLLGEATLASNASASAASASASVSASASPLALLLSRMGAEVEAAVM